MLTAVTKAYKQFRSGVSRVSIWFSAVAIVSAILMMFLTLADTAMRGIVRHGITGTIEISTLLVVPVVFFSVAMAQGTKRNVRVELLYNLVSPRLRLVFDFVAWVTALVLFSIMLWEAIDNAVISLATQEFRYGAVPFPWWPPKVLLAVGLIPMWLVLFCDTIDLSHSLYRHRRDEEEKN